MSRILGPIVSCLEQLGELYNREQEKEGVRYLIDTGYGGLEKLRKDILYDFFRSAFDGSGADNFFDAGRYVVVGRPYAWWCHYIYGELLGCARLFGHHGGVK